MKIRTLFGVVLTAWLSGCATSSHPPLALADAVDLDRFMGDWYVIAHIPTFIERHATDAVESYRIDQDGSIATTFRFHEGTPQGPLREYHPRGYVVANSGNAIWGMQFIWPIRADYRIIGLAPDYRWTVIGRSARDYVWLMARQPTLSVSDYADALRVINDAGYATDNLRQVPQSNR
jgi:apolipoprotein D and lipocalin family protein